jgi:hypothetical protein
LKAGDRFRFVYNIARNGGRDTVSPHVLVKRSAGWYEDEAGKRWRTGRTSAVQRAVQP